MGVLSYSENTMPQQMHRRLSAQSPIFEPARVCGLAVGSEPAYITSWASAEFCAPPGLEPNELTRRYEDEGSKELDDFSTLTLPCKVTCGSRKSSIDVNDIGHVLKEVANYDHKLDMPCSHKRFKKIPRAIGRGAQDDDQDNFSNANRRQKRHQKRRCLLLIATQLHQLEGEDPSKLLVVRKINRLGFNSANLLTEHYGRYGTVSNVLLSNNHEKQASAPFPVRLRPSGIGYVLFESADAAARALEEGATQVVAGVEIAVRAIEKRQAPEMCCGNSDGAESGSVDDGSSTPESRRVEDKLALWDQIARFEGLAGI